MNKRSTTMIPLSEAMKRAENIPFPLRIPVHMKIEVALAYMQLHGITKTNWRGELLVLHTPATVTAETVDVEKVKE